MTRKDGETPLFDGLGSERTVTNTGGAVQATLTLSAFGQAVASSGSSTDPYQYAATSRYRNDGDAGLSLVGCRYYDAQVGAFISRDTYPDQKPYAYCDGDPVNAVDPDGHQGQPKSKINWGRLLGITAFASTVGGILSSGITTYYHGQATRDTLTATRNMQRMINDYAANHGPDVDLTNQYNILNSTVSDAAKATGNVAKDAANDIYTNVK